MSSKFNTFISKNRFFLVRFLLPVLIGLASGYLFKYLASFDIQTFGFVNNTGEMSQNLAEYLLKYVTQISEIIKVVIEYFVPFMIIIYITNAIINISSENIIIFISKYFIILFITLLACVLFSLAIAYIFVPFSIIKLPEMQSSIYIDPFFSIPVIKNLAFYSIIISFILGLGIKYLVVKFKNKQINLLNLIVRIFTNAEDILEYLIKNILLNLIPIWIITSFIVSTYERGGGQIIAMELILSAIILVAQAIWLIANNYFASRFDFNLFRQMNKSATRIYLYVTSMAGLSTGALIPTIIEEQEKIGFEESKAKFISVSSFNMPGSLISNIIFAYGISLLFGLNLSFGTMFIYSISVATLLIVAPALPGGPFVLTQGLLTSQLAFTENMVGLFSGFYFRQGTSNASVNNAADFYMAGYLDKKIKEKTNEQLNNTVRNRTN